jgi:hypothetical protein
VALDELGERGAVAFLGALHQLAVTGLSVGARLFRRRELMLLHLRRIGQGPGTVKHAGSVVKGQAGSFLG